MSQRVVLFRIGESFFSIPFTYVDEIVGFERIARKQDLEEGVLPDGPDSPYWVIARGKWYPLIQIIPGTSAMDSTQVIVVKHGATGQAYAVDQVLGIEVVENSIPFPEAAKGFTDHNFAGVRILDKRIVLELDLSMLI